VLSCGSVAHDYNTNSIRAAGIRGSGVFVTVELARRPTDMPEETISSDTLESHIDGIFQRDNQQDVMDEGLNRRAFLKASGAVSCAAFGHLVSPCSAAAQSALGKRPQISLTVDDPSVAGTLSWREMNQLFLNVLSARRLKAALFVCGMRVDHVDGRQLVGDWDDAGHLIGSHSYSHMMFLSKTSYEEFTADFVRNEAFVTPYRNRVRLFRYPFLKEGDTAEKRDRFRRRLRDQKYRVGHVTIDASDWYVDTRWTARRKTVPGTEPNRYRDYLLTHLIDRATYYRQLMVDVVGRDVPHTLLVHYRELIAISLDELLEGFERAGWEWVNADGAFADPVYERAPATLPAGESLAWALAKESGKFADRLRYPGENAPYEASKLDALGL
jgi:peptidoglycan-N-acetylglucosamine deacetylase